MMQALGISSSISIPVSVEEEQVAVVLTLFGACPNQFETQRMQQFCPQSATSLGTDVDAVLLPPAVPP
jgi:hypothetical protein